MPAFTARAAQRIAAEAKGAVSPAGLYERVRLVGVIQMPVSDHCKMCRGDFAGKAVDRAAKRMSVPAAAR